MRSFDNKSIKALNHWLVSEQLMTDHNPIELTRLLDEATDSIAQGYQRLLNHTQKKHETNPYGLDPKIVEKLKKKKTYQQMLEKHVTFQNIFHYTPEMMAKLGKVAIEELHKHHYEEASQIFLFGLYLNPFVAWFWQGLARCWQGMQKRQEALFAHGMAINCQPLDADLYKAAVNYCLEIDEPGKAKALLEYGLQEALSTPEQASSTHQQQLEAILAFVTLSKEKR